MKKSSVILISIIAILAVFIIFSSITIVRPGTVGVITYFGAVQDRLLPEGMHFVVPIMTKVEHIDVRVQKVQSKATASSRDLQPVTSEVALNFYVDKTKANLVFQELGPNYISTIIDPTIQESIKSATARFNAEELITKRPEVKELVFKYIKKRLAENHIIVTDFSIVDFNFSKEFNQAIENKQIAEQKALTAENDLKRIKTEAQQEIEKAKGDAEAQELLKATLDDRVLELKAIEKWDGKLPTVMGEGSTPFVDLKGTGK